MLGVIVLTDNRQAQTTDQKGSQYYRNSAFKGTLHTNIETEVDPLEFTPEVQGDSQEENLMIELGRRLVFLEQRVESLSKNQVLNAEEN